MRLGSHHSMTTTWPLRPFKIYYSRDLGRGTAERLGPPVSCSYPESVVRSAALRIISGRADVASVWFDGSEFAGMFRRADGSITFTVY